MISNFERKDEHSTLLKVVRELSVILEHDQAIELDHFIALVLRDWVDEFLFLFYLMLFPTL